MGNRKSPSLWTSIWLGLGGGSRISGKACIKVCVWVGGGGGGGILNKDIYDKNI